MHIHEFLSLNKSYKNSVKSFLCQYPIFDNVWDFHWSVYRGMVLLVVNLSRDTDVSEEYGASIFIL